MMRTDIRQMLDSAIEHSATTGAAMRAVVPAADLAVAGEYLWSRCKSVRRTDSGHEYLGAAWRVRLENPGAVTRIYADAGVGSVRLTVGDKVVYLTPLDAQRTATMLHDVAWLVREGQVL